MILNGLNGMKLKRFFCVSGVALALAGCGGSGGGDRPQVNRAPLFGAVADQSIVANAPSAPIAFTVSDDLTGAAALTVTGTSSNEVLVPTTSLVFGGSGANRSVIVMPVVDRVGSATLTLTVRDPAGLTGMTSFAVTINPVQRSFAGFVRDVFDGTPDSSPQPINAVAFDQDAADDDFADLLQ